MNIYNSKGNGTKAFSVDSLHKIMSEIMQKKLIWFTERTFLYSTITKIISLTPYSRVEKKKNPHALSLIHFRLIIKSFTYKIHLEYYGI